MQGLALGEPAGRFWYDGDAEPGFGPAQQLEGIIAGAEDRGIKAVGLTLLGDHGDMTAVQQERLVFQLMEGNLAVRSVRKGIPGGQQHGFRR